MEESLEDMEARLYAQVYHDTSGVNTVPESTEFLPPNLNKQSNKRYWQRSKNLSTHNSDNDFASHQYSSEKSQAPQKLPVVVKDQTQLSLGESEVKTESSAVIKTFVPYTSILSFMASPPAPPPAKLSQQNNFEKKKNKSAKFPKSGKLLNPMNKQGVTKGKSAMKIEIIAKKQKATMARKKAAQSRVVTTIELDDSDESDCVPIELPPPPLISLDSSDEEIVQKRPMSPSTSSIMSDDFIFAGDKRRLENPFRSDEIYHRNIAQVKETLQKAKALTKVSSSSSSDSTRSSCERTAASKEQKTDLVPEPRKKRKTAPADRVSIEQDSIYGAKTTVSKTVQDKPTESSEEETPCVNVRIQNVRRRKSTGSRKKSTEGDQSEPEDPKTKQVTSTPVVPAKRRSRFITPSYNDEEFASMISTILRSGDGDVMEDDESNEEHENDESDSQAVKEGETSIISVGNSTSPINDIETQIQSETDCEIIEQPSLVVEVPDEEEAEDPVVSDSDDSIRGVTVPINCDLSLNVTQTSFKPHEHISNKAETSDAIVSASDLKFNPEIGWNDEMKFFYNGNWGETFNISTMLDEMPRDPKLWKVNNQDRYRTPDNGCRVRCRKCNEVGHFAAKCNRPKKRVVCFMCGEEGHRETRCPNSICLRCGKPNKMFATVCTSCHRLSKRHCPLCNYQGHDMDQCPDKWRRYHSTTTDTNDLNSDYAVNTRVYCSICARRGHFAENCNQFFKTISGLITSSCLNIKSHKPSYPRINLKSFDDEQDEQTPKVIYLALFSYFPHFEFNFKFGRHVRMYPKFLEQFKQHQQRALEALPSTETSQKKQTRKKRKRNSKGELKIAEAKTPELHISVGSEGNRTITSGEHSSEAHEDSNSNYSFSEFFKQSQQSKDQVFKSPDSVADSSFDNEVTSTVDVQPVEIRFESTQVRDNSNLVINPFAHKLPEFIPLSSTENNQPLPTYSNQKLNISSTSRQDYTGNQKVQIERAPEVSCDARMLLTKNHFALLSNIDGVKFLRDLQDRFDVTTQFKWDNTGNTLVINGFPSNQSIFHLEVREYLYRVEVERHEAVLKASSQVPKSKVSIVNFLKVNLQAIPKLKLFSAKKTLEAMEHAEKSRDHKKVLKCRKSLNIAFVGDAELGDGGIHVGALRRILQMLERELNQGKVDIVGKLREEITEHMEPIFSTMNHGNYHKLFQQYSKVIKQRQKKKLVINPILLN